jgi:D-aminopeptidase
MLSWLPIVDRKDAHTIVYNAQDMVAISRFIEFMTTYSIEIEP